MSSLLAIVSGSDFTATARPQTLRIHPQILALDVEGFLREQMDPFISLGVGIAFMWPLGYWNHQEDAEAGYKTVIGVEPPTAPTPGKPVLSSVHSANVAKARLPQGKRLLDAMERALAPRVRRVHDAGLPFVVYIGGDDKSASCTDRAALTAVAPFMRAGVRRWGLDTAPCIDRAIPTPTRTLADLLTYLGDAVDVEPALMVNKGFEAWRRLSLNGAPRYGVWSTYQRARVAEAGPQPGAESGWWNKASDPARRYTVSFGSELLDPRPEWPSTLGHAERRVAEAEYWLTRGYDVAAGLHNVPAAEVARLLSPLSSAGAA